MRWSRTPWVGCASRPAPGEHGFLADPGLIFKFLSRCWPGAWLGSRPQPGGEVFLKSSTANSFCPLWRGRADILRNPSGQFTAHRRLINRNAELFEYTMRQVLSAPTHDTVGRNRSALNKPSECRCLSLSLAGLPVALPSMRCVDTRRSRCHSSSTWSRMAVPIRAGSEHRPSNITLMFLPAQEARRALNIRRKHMAVHAPITGFPTGYSRPYDAYRRAAHCEASGTVRLIDSDFLPFGNPLNESPSMLDGISSP